MTKPDAMNESDYRPIDCGVHDRLEDLAVRGIRCLIQVRTSEHGVELHEGTITDVLARAGAEYLVLDSGVEIRLDKIVDFQEA